MKDILKHLEDAVAATKSGDHSKARHHIGHAFRNSSNLTRGLNLGGQMGKPRTQNPLGSAGSGGDMKASTSPQPVTDASDPQQGAGNSANLRSRLSGFGK